MKHRSPTTVRTATTAAATLLLLAASAAPAQELIYGFGSADTGATFSLYSFNSNAPGTLLSNVPISGVTVGTLVGIDFRPATGQLFGLSFDGSPSGGVGSGTGQLYTINLGTGAASAIGGALNIGEAGTSFGFGFNPTVDRIRVVTGAASNFRINPNNGAIVDFDGNAANGTQFDGELTYPNNAPPDVPVIAGADYLGARLFDIDVANNLISEQGAAAPSPVDSPNNGNLTALGNLGVVPVGAGTLGFDIGPTSGIAYLQTDTGDAGPQDDLFLLTLTGASAGATSLVGSIGAAGLNTYDIAVFTVPEPGTYALFAVGLGALAFGVRRRRQMTA